MTPNWIESPWYNGASRRAATRWRSPLAAERHPLYDDESVHPASPLARVLLFLIAVRGLKLLSCALRARARAVSHGCFADHSRSASRGCSVVVHSSRAFRGPLLTGGSADHFSRVLLTRILQGARRITRACSGQADRAANRIVVLCEHFWCFSRGGRAPPAAEAQSVRAYGSWARARRRPLL